MGVAVGIDLGTTNTVVAAVRDGKPVTLADDAGRTLIPSFVAFHPSGKVLVGESAKDRRVVDPSNTIYSVKRLIGRTYACDEVQRALKTMPFELVEGDKQGIRVVARGEVYTLPEISAFVLRRAKAVAEAALGEVVDKAVITVPANFNDPQRAATKLAGKLAGFDVLRILNEPTAAAMAYGHAEGMSERIAVYDLGGGTFDVTLLDLSGEVFEVLATGGDTSLGGDDIDQAIAMEMTNFFLQKFRFDARTDPAVRALLRARAERLKHVLSDREEATIEMNDVVRGEGGAFVQATFGLDRKRLEAIAAPFIDRTIETCRFSIETVGLDPLDIERVLLVGGSTRMPLVVRRVEEYFQKKASAKVNPDEVVAQGAAVQAAALTKAQPGAAATDKGAHARAAVAVALPTPPLDPGAAMAPSGPGPAAASKELPRRQTIPGPASLPEPPAPITPPVPTPMSAPVAVGRIPLVKQAVARQPIAPTPLVKREKRAPDPFAPAIRPASDDDVTKQIDSALLEFMLEAPDAGAEPEEAVPVIVEEDIVEEQPASLDPPSFEFDLLPPSKPAAPAPSAAAARAVAPPRRPPPPARGEARPATPGGELPALQPEAPVLPTLELPTTAAAALPAPDSSAAAPRPLPVAPQRAAPLLIDVTPISLGVEVAGGFCDFLIRANTPVPCDRTRVFRTASDNQVAVRVRVVQGESEKFAENTYLGDLELTGLRSATRGEVEVAVTFEIDADGILNVRAKEEATGRETVARMNLLGAQTDADEVAAMMARQRKHEVA
jgi:molecular chaperone DnaK